MESKPKTVRPWVRQSNSERRCLFRKCPTKGSQIVPFRFSVYFFGAEHRSIFWFVDFKLNSFIIFFFIFSFMIFLDFPLCFCLDGIFKILLTQPRCPSYLGGRQGCVQNILKFPPVENKTKQKKSKNARKFSMSLFWSKTKKRKYRTWNIILWASFNLRFWRISISLDLFTLLKKDCPPTQIRLLAIVRRSIFVGLALTEKCIWFLYPIFHCRYIANWKVLHRQTFWLDITTSYFKGYLKRGVFFFAYYKCIQY